MRNFVFPATMVVAVLAASSLQAADAAPRSHHRHHHRHWPSRQGVYQPDTADGGVYDIIAGSNKVRINGVGQVITNRHP